MKKNCYICGEESESFLTAGDYDLINCNNCKKYKISRTAYTIFDKNHINYDTRYRFLKDAEIINGTPFIRNIFL